MTLEDLDETLRQMKEAPLGAYADRDSIVRLERQLAELEALVSKEVAVFARAGEWALDGAKTPKAWLTTRTGMAGRAVGRQLRRGRHLEDLACFDEAWSAGRISGEHLDQIIRVKNPRSEKFLLRDEAIMCEWGTTYTFKEFVRLVDEWIQWADPDGAELSDMERRARRDFIMSKGIDGTWIGSLTLDPISAEIVDGELSVLEKELFAADWAEAEERLGRRPLMGELSRDNGQRRADALVEMAIRSATMPKDGRRPAPLFSVLIDHPTLKGRVVELAQSRTVLSAGALLPWMTTAYVERAIFEPDGRVEVSPAARFFTGATRRAIELRDLECTHPYCDLRMDQSQGDHVLGHAKGGLTVQSNGRLLCGFHNRLRNYSDDCERPPPDR